MQKVNWDKMPQTCKALPQWVLWRAVKKEGRITKIPFGQNGRPASSTDPKTWCTFDEAKRALEGGFGDGPGFVFTLQAGITGIDLDHCRDPQTSQIDLWAQQIIKRLNSYTEISPSGAGVHILIRGKMPDGVSGKKKVLTGEGYRPNAAIEIYSTGRYFTMTGDRLDGYPGDVEDRQTELTEIYKELFGDQPEAQPTAPQPTAARNAAADLSDDALILKAKTAKNGREFEELWAGSTRGYGGDDSAADLALMNMLAYWTGGDPDRMERLFSRSKLGQREKWKDRPDYRNRTIKRAISDTKEFYQPDVHVCPATGEISLPTGIRLWTDTIPPGVPGVDKDGIAYMRIEKTDKKGGEKTYIKTKICDGYCCITEETRDEAGEATFTLSGRGSRDGHEFKFDITGRDFSDSRKLKAALVAHFGARNRVKDLTGDIIQSMTLDVTKLTLVNSPRWINNRLAIPGLDGAGFKFNLTRRVPADLSTGEESLGLEAFKLIFETWPTEKAAILIATVLASPICGRWFNGDRFGLALIGTTGRGLKTEALKHALAIYGAGFLSEEALLRWGDGATTKATLAIASACGCLPVGIDNYKPTNREAPGKFVSVVHTILEGRERERLNRNAELRETREYAATLLVTGEDLPEEASTVARLLPVEWSTEPNLQKLTELQKIANHLPAAGRLWCQHLSNLTGVDMDAWIRSRAELVTVAREAGAINPGRIGTTTAILKTVWKIALNSPLGGILKDYTTAFENGLASLIQTTAVISGEATEASQFVEILKELISSGRCVVLERLYTDMELTRPNVIGWRLKEPDADAGGVAILPRLAIEAVRRVTGPQAQSVGTRALYRQLYEAGYITEGSGKGEKLKVKRAGARSTRVLVFKQGVLIDDSALDVINLTKAAAEDDERRKAAARLEQRINQAVAVA